MWLLLNISESCIQCLSLQSIAKISKARPFAGHSSQKREMYVYPILYIGFFLLFFFNHFFNGFTEQVKQYYVIILLCFWNLWNHKSLDTGITNCTFFSSSLSSFQKLWKIWKNPSNVTSWLNTYTTADWDLLNINY